MGARGPLPLPSSVKAARGTLRPCRTAANEPQATGLPRAPKDLPKECKAEFKRLVKLLSAMNLIGTIDGNALERYVRTWREWRVAMQMIEKTGSVFPIKDSEGKVKFRRSPYLDVAATLAGHLDKLEQAFALHPSARSRIEVQVPQVGTDDKSRFFDDATPMRIAQ